MKSKLSICSLAAGAALAVTALGVSTAAQADNFTWSVGVSSPGVEFDVSNARSVYGQPVYVQPYYAPQIYTQPQVIYQQPQVIYQQPQVIYQQPRPYYAPQVVYVRPHPFYVQPRPVHVQPQVVYAHPHNRVHNRPNAVVNGGRPVFNGWQHPGEDHQPFYPANRSQGRVAGAGQSNDSGRNHH